jgi:hypothetical protein
MKISYYFRRKKGENKIQRTGKGRNGKQEGRMSRVINK